MLVAVGSTNPIKIEAVRRGFARLGLEGNQAIAVRGCETCSGVAEQPLSRREIREGALWRGYRALQLLPTAAYGVGAEGGAYEDEDGSWQECAAIAVINRAGIERLAYTASMPLPPRIVGHLRDGRDLNEAVEAETGIAQIGKDQGFWGYMTLGGVSRMEGYAMGVAFALAGFTRPQLWAQ